MYKVEQQVHLLFHLLANLEDGILLQETKEVGVDAVA
jgi:hypothetical protein